MNKYTYLLLIVISVVLKNSNVVSQISAKGYPRSFEVDTLFSKNVIPEHLLPNISNQYERTKVLNDAKLKKKTIYGKYIFDNIDYISEAEKFVLKDSSKLYILKISSPTAEGMQFFFNEFYLPIGGKLFFYNEDKTQVLGAFTSLNNRENNRFGTQPIFGQNIFIEYSEPYLVNTKLRLNIEKIVHVFRKGLLNNSKDSKTDPHITIGGSAECELNVACMDQYPWGDWGNEIKSVAMILASTSSFPNSYGQIVSGTLLNIAGGYNEVSSPYLLSCAHAIWDIEDPYADVQDWVFLFNLDDPSCNPTMGGQYYLNSSNSLYGADLIAYDDNFAPDIPVSDYLLCQLFDTYHDINNNIDVAYAGWDISVEAGNTPAILCFHHPADDTKKFCFSDELGETSVIWHNECEQYFVHVPGNNWWNITWEYGIVEGGSSGSALFNTDHRVIGQLWGSDQYCEDFNAPPCGNLYVDGESVFGKFSTSWADGNFDYYLDPLGMNITSIPSFDPCTCGNYICEPICGESYINCEEDCPDPGGGGGSTVNCNTAGDGFSINHSDNDIAVICPDNPDIYLYPLDENCRFAFKQISMDMDDSYCDSPSISCNSYGWYNEKCSCKFWAFFLSIYECDNNLNTIGNEHCSWFYSIRGNSPGPSSLNISNYLYELGITLQSGKYYRIKLASEYGTGWEESIEYFYIAPNDLLIDNESLIGDYFALDNIIIHNSIVSSSNIVTLIVGESVSISPNSSIEYGASFHAYINPNIEDECAIAPIMANNIFVKTDSVIDSLENSNNVMSISPNRFKQGINIYPNPTTNKLNIYLNKEISGLLEIELKDIMGKTVYFDSGEMEKHKVLDLAAYPKGIYLLKIKTGEKIFVEKVIRQ